MQEFEKLVCASDNWDPSWKWVSEDARFERLDWRFFDATDKSVIERWITRPNLNRVGVAFRAAAETKRNGACLLISHQPRVTCLTSMASWALRGSAPHIAFTFNFTDLPGRMQRAVMRRAFRDVDRFFSFSSFECDMYSEVFSIPRERFQMLHFGFDLAPEPDDVVAVRTDRFVSSVGGEGRDYPTLVEAMRRLPDIPLEIVCRPESLRHVGSAPPNVSIRTNLDIGEVHALMRSSRFMVLPLAHERVACGHVTLVTAMKMAKAQVVTDSLGVADYLSHERRALLAKPGDADDLAQQIERLWLDDALCERLAEEGRMFAAEKCTDRNVAAVLDAYISSGAGRE